jgi:hypothetical protein
MSEQPKYRQVRGGYEAKNPLYEQPDLVPFAPFQVHAYYSSGHPSRPWALEHVDQKHRPNIPDEEMQHAVLGCATVLPESEYLRLRAIEAAARGVKDYLGPDPDSELSGLRFDGENGLADVLAALLAALTPAAKERKP